MVTPQALAVCIVFIPSDQLACPLDEVPALPLLICDILAASYTTAPVTFGIPKPYILRKHNI
jgi:hypothetical protein